MFVMRLLEEHVLTPGGTRATRSSEQVPMQFLQALTQALSIPMVAGQFFLLEGFLWAAHAPNGPHFGRPRDCFAWVGWKKEAGTKRT